VRVYAQVRFNGDQTKHTLSLGAVREGIKNYALCVCVLCLACASYEFRACFACSTSEACPKQSIGLILLLLILVDF